MMRKYLHKKIEEYLKLSELPSSDKVESALIITEELMKDIQFKKLLHLKKLDEMKEDIQEEVLDTIRKKTYGFFSLKEYQASKKPGNLKE